MVTRHNTAHSFKCVYFTGMHSVNKCHFRVNCKTNSIVLEITVNLLNTMNCTNLQP